MKLSILIPSLISRTDSLNCLKVELHGQADELELMSGVDYEILTDIDSGEKSIGEKRNTLLARAKGDYLCFFDDDDTPSGDYLKKLFECIGTKCDNCSMTGAYYVDGKFDGLFEHSISYMEYRTNPPTTGIKYERYPNHLNVIKSSIAKRFKFPEINHGEDTSFATQIFHAGVLNNETKIDGVIYHYQFKTIK